MRVLIALALVTSLTTGMALADTVNFDDSKTGSPPPGWTATKTGKGDPKWEVVADDSAPSKPNVLKQSGEATYPVCIQERHQRQRRLRRSEVQARLRQGGPGRRRHLAVQRCR